MSSRYSLDIIESSELDNFARKTIELISYLDYRTVEEEIFRLSSFSHISHFWIKKDDEIIGVVKISLFHFYDLGLIPNIDNREIPDIMNVIELQMRNAFTGRIHANIQGSHMNQMIDLNWKEEYSRYRMGISLSEIKNLASYSDLKISEYRDDYFEKLCTLFTSAYEGGIDEKIGMINKDTIVDSMNDIIQGKYGELQRDLSVVAFSRWGNIIGASLITLSENCAFLVIIGVTSKHQRKGLGRKLVSYNVDRCNEKGMKCMKLWVTAKNPAVEFYQSMGFEILTKVSSMTKSAY